MKYIFHSNNRVLKNASWMLMSKIVNIASGLLVSVIVTRYLGVEQKGELAEVMAIGSFFGFFASFGLGDILIKEFSANRVKSRKIAMSAIGLLMFGGGLAFLLSIGAAIVLKAEISTVKLIMIYSSSYLFQFLRVFEYWLYSRAESKLFTVAQVIVHFSFLIIRFTGTMIKADLIWFVWCISGEGIVTCISLVVCYVLCKEKLEGDARFDRAITRRLFEMCVPILVMGFAATIYMKVDQIMVGKMLDSSALGIYSVAVSLAEYWYFIPMVIYTSFLPMLTELRGEKEKFYNALQKFADIMGLIGIVALIGVFVLGETIVYILYGDEFMQAAQILMIYMWSGLFTCISFVGQAYYVISDNTKIVMYINLLGAALNIILNLILIPKLEIYGAAVATVLEYAILCFGQMIVYRKKYGELYCIERKAFFPVVRTFELLAKKYHSK